MEVANLTENLKVGNIYGLIGNVNLTTNNKNIGIVSYYKFSGTVKKFLNSKKDEMALQMVMLDSDIIGKNVSDLSVAEIKKAILAKILIENKPYIVLDFFEKELTHQEKEAFKRLFKKLIKDYQKTIIIHTNDITFIWDIASSIIAIDSDNKPNIIEKSDYFKVIDLLDEPPIISFTNLIKEKKVKIANHQNVLDLLKEIYRLKG